ncbi:hypothetical protein B0H14DRAFT_3135499 [Mycena olivaceomarginata]|nr:hypothetical protein B0H14DRAFT_3135499 [Mycena olivaceomarginata]
MSPSAPTRATLSSTLSSRTLSLSSSPMSLEEDGDEGDEPNDSHDNNSNSTEEVSPVSPAVPIPSPMASSPQQLQDTAASIKRARSGSASASAHSFYMPLPIHTTIPMPPPRANGAPPAAASRSALMRHLRRCGPELLPICLSFTWHEWMGIACNVITIWHAFMMICEESVALARRVGWQQY